MLHGQRLNTLINLKIEDIDFDNKVVILKVVKNRKQQIIPLCNSILSILSEYLKIRGGQGSDYLFCTHRGQQFSKGGLQHTIAKYNKSRYVEKTSIHQFRHTFAKGIVMNGGREFKLQSLLGHSTLDMSKNYVEMFGEDLKENYNNYNPLETFIKSTNINGKTIKMKK